jgi:hypothetical protein
MAVEGASPMSDRVTRILLEIGRLTVNELNELRKRMGGDPPDSGVREPIAPRPPTRPPREAPPS